MSHGADYCYVCHKDTFLSPTVGGCTCAQDVAPAVAATNTLAGLYLLFKELVKEQGLKKELRVIRKKDHIEIKPRKAVRK